MSARPDRIKVWIFWLLRAHLVLEVPKFVFRLSPRTRQWIGWFWMGGVMKNFGAEYGLLVSWSGFKSSIINETAKQFFEIRLWTHKEISEEFLRYYDQMETKLDLLAVPAVWACVRLSPPE